MKCFYPDSKGGGGQSFVSEYENEEDFQKATAVFNKSFPLINTLYFVLKLFLFFFFDGGNN